MRSKTRSVQAARRREYADGGGFSNPQQAPPASTPDDDCTYHGGFVLPEEDGYAPTHAQLRYLLGMGYPALSLLQLDRGRAQELIRAIEANGWKQVAFKFPNGITQRPRDEFRKWDGPLPDVLKTALESRRAEVYRPHHPGYASSTAKRGGNLHQRMKYVMFLLQQLGPDKVPAELWQAIRDLRSLVKRSEPIDFTREPERLTT